MGIPLFHSATVKSLLVGICCFKMCSINRLDLIVQCLLCFEKLLQWVVLRKILLSKCHSINKVVLFQVSVWRHLCRTHICLENKCCITWQHSEQWTHHIWCCWWWRWSPSDVSLQGCYHVSATCHYTLVSIGSVISLEVMQSTWELFQSFWSDP